MMMMKITCAKEMIIVIMVILMIMMILRMINDHDDDDDLEGEWWQLYVQESINNPLVPTIPQLQILPNRVKRNQEMKRKCSTNWIRAEKKETRENFLKMKKNLDFWQFSVKLLLFGDTVFHFAEVELILWFHYLHSLWELGHRWKKVELANWEEVWAETKPETKLRRVFEFLFGS